MYRSFLNLLTFLGDFVFLNLAFAAIYWLRFESGILTQSYAPEHDLADYFGIMLLFWAGWFALFLLAGLYRNWTKESRLDQAIVVVKTISLGILLIFLFTGVDQIAQAWRTRDWHVLFTQTKTAILAQYWASLVFFAVFNRISLATFFKRLLVRGIGADRVIIVGANDSGRELRHKLQQFPALGYQVAGYVDDDGRKKGRDYDELPVFGTYSDLTDICVRNRIASVIISKVSSSPNEIMKIIQYCAPTRVTVHMEPDLMDVIKGHLKTHQLYGIPLLVLLPEHMPDWQAQIKRFTDIALSFAVLLLGFPLWALISILIKLDSPGPVIYKQERVGQNGKPFTILKFRTMVADAEKLSGPVWAGQADPRTTRSGRFLRKTRLDEIPQFLNVLKGEMSMVGPRPEREFFIQKLKEEIPIYVRRMKMKPGITGWAQVKHHYDQSIEDVKQKVLYDLYYFENMSMRLDLKILLKSVWVVFTGKGAH